MLNTALSNRMWVVGKEANLKGQGGVTYKDGTRYVGSFRNALQHGKGKIDKHGELMYKGKWTDGVVDCSGQSSNPKNAQETYEDSVSHLPQDLFWVWIFEALIRSDPASESRKCW